MTQGVTKMATCNCLGPRGGDSLCPCMMRSVRAEVKQILINHFYLGTLTDSDMFKYTPVYTGDTWSDEWGSAEQHEENQ